MENGKHGKSLVSSDLIRMQCGKNGEFLQKISCISAKKSSKLDVLRSFSIIFAVEK